jgi:hypothetical protein
MSSHVVEKRTGYAGGDQSEPRQQRHDYEPAEAVRIGTALEITQGNSTKDLDGYYGPGWTRWW